MSLKGTLVELTLSRPSCSSCLLTCSPISTMLESRLNVITFESLESGACIVVGNNGIGLEPNIGLSPVELGIIDGATLFVCLVVLEPSKKKHMYD